MSFAPIQRRTLFRHNKYDNKLRLKFNPQQERRAKPVSRARADISADDSDSISIIHLNKLNFCELFICAPLGMTHDEDMIREGAPKIPNGCLFYMCFTLGATSNQFIVAMCGLYKLDRREGRCGAHTTHPDVD